MKWERPLELLAQAVQWLLNRVRRRRPPIHGLPERLRRERDSLVAVYGAHWLMTTLAVVGKWGFALVSR